MRVLQAIFAWPIVAGLEGHTGVDSGSQPVKAVAKGKISVDSRGHAAVFVAEEIEQGGPNKKKTIKACQQKGKTRSACSQEWRDAKFEAKVAKAHADLAVSLKACAKKNKNKAAKCAAKAHKKLEKKLARVDAKKAKSLAKAMNKSKKNCKKKKGSCDFWGALDKAVAVLAMNDPSSSAAEVQDAEGAITTSAVQTNLQQESFVETSEKATCTPIGRMTTTDIYNECKSCFEVYAEWCGSAIDVCAASPKDMRCAAAGVGGATFMESCMKAIFASQTSKCNPEAADGQIYAVFKYRSDLFQQEFACETATQTSCFDAKSNFVAPALLQDVEDAKTRADDDDSDDDTDKDESSFVEEGAKLSSSTTTKGELRRRRAELRRRSLPRMVTSCDYSR